MNKTIKTILLYASGLGIFLSSILYDHFPVIIPKVLLASTIIFTLMIFLDPYPGKEMRGRRLQNMRMIACGFIFGTVYLMWFGYKEWPLTLLINAFLLLYASIMMGKILAKERGHNKDKRE